MRWLLLKDLQILRRSPVLVLLLVGYAVGIAMLIGTATRSAPTRPEVAFVNEIPPSKDKFVVGGQTLRASRFTNELFRAIRPVPVRTREQAIEKVRSGDVLAAIVIPSDTTERLQAALALSPGRPPPTVEVIFNGSNPLQVVGVQSEIDARLADANRAISKELTVVAARYLDILVRGGDFTVLGRRFEILGLQEAEQIAVRALRKLPKGSPERDELERVRIFAGLAVRNVDLATPVLRSVGSPIAVKSSVLNGRKTPEEQYYVAVAMTLSALFVALMLSAGMLSLEREEHTWSRLVRGAVGPLQLLVSKIGLGAIAGLSITAVMAVAIAAFVPLEAGRLPLWLSVVAIASASFAAAGVALGSLARDVRAASLLAVLFSLPIAFLALIPQTAMSPSLYDVVRVASAPFSFRPALHAVDGALNGGQVAGPLVHTIVLTLAYTMLARIAVRRMG
jgi:ABC-2 type transport system permease protein